MTNYKELDPVDKHCPVKDLDILYKFDCPDGTCKTCGKNHRFEPKYGDTSTSIEVITLLIEKLRIWEELKMREKTL